MRQLYTAVLLSIALAYLAYRARTSGLLLERPYEEALFLIALRTDAPAFPGPDAVWSEHPPLAYLLLHGCAWICGADVGVLRQAWFTVYLLTFLALLYYGRPSVSRTEPDVPCFLEALTEAVRGLFVLSVFASPLLLVSGSRVGPEAVTYGAFVAYLASGIAFLRTWSALAAVGLGLAGALLLSSHAYGWVYVLASVAALAATVGRAYSRVLVLKLLLIVLLALSPVAIDPRVCAARLDLLRGHYWAESVGARPFGMPLAGIWVPLSELSFQLPTLPVAAQAVTGLLLLWIVIWGKDLPARWLALTCLGIVPLCWLGECVGQSKIMIYHWLGLMGVSGVCALARGLGRRLLFLTGLGASCIVLIPGVASALFVVGDGPKAVQRAAEVIKHQLDGSDVVVFAGARTYVTLAPYLDRDSLGRSYVFLRTHGRPDSFVGRKLVSPSRLLVDNAWPDFPADRIVVVQFEAAQQVVVPQAGWVVEEADYFLHNSLAIGQITIETRRRLGPSLR